MEENKLDIKRIEMYSEWKRFWDFWWYKPDLSMREAFTVYLMNQNNETKQN